MKYQVRVKTTRYEDVAVEADSLSEACKIGEKIAWDIAANTGLEVASAETISIKSETEDQEKK